MRRSFFTRYALLNAAPHSDITKFHAHKQIIHGFLYFARQSAALQLYFQDLIVRNFMYKLFWHLFLQFVPRLVGIHYLQNF